MASARATWAAVVVGLLTVLAAAGEAALAWHVIYTTPNGIRRMNSVRALDMLFTPLPAAEQAEVLQQVGVAEAVWPVWLGIVWVAAGLLALAGLWTVIRRRIAWRLAWVGAVAMIVAGVATAVGIHIMVEHAGFPILPSKSYAIGLAVFSAPGWLWLFALMIRRRARRSAPADVATPGAGGNGSVAAAAAGDQKSPEGQSSPDDLLARRNRP